MVLSIFSCVYVPSIGLLWRNVYLGLNGDSLRPCLKITIQEKFILVEPNILEFSYVLKYGLAPLSTIPIWVSLSSHWAHSI